MPFIRKISAFIKNQRKPLTSLAVLTVIGIVFINYLQKNIHHYENLSFISPEMFILLLLAFFLGSLFQGKVLMSLIRTLNVRLKLFEALGLTFVSRLGNNITPFRGGIAVRAFYLKKKYGCDYSESLATVTANHYIMFFIASFIGIVSIIIIYFEKQIFNYIFLAIFGITFIIMFLVLIFQPQFPEVKNKFINKGIKIITGWYILKRKKKIQLEIVFYNLLALLARCLNIQIRFYIFGFEIAFIEAIFLTAITPFWSIASITPAGIGVRELLIVLSATTIGISVEEMLPVTILGRVFAVTVSFIMGIFFSYLLIQKNSSKQAV
jgi:uncharacterized membrane protein YbhN (UPF0104 family)